MARRSNSETLGKDVRDRIRVDVLNGRWKPGEKLQLIQLSEHYQASSTVIREALTRLCGERLVQLRPNRGFFAPELALDELRDLSELRCLTEEFGVRLAIERGDLSWESELMAAHHTLERTPRRHPDDPHHVTEEWSEAHQRFHGKLIEACGVPVLIDLAATLSDATDLYRRWAAPSPDAQVRDVEAEHREILNAVLARDVGLSGRLLRRHYEMSMEIITRAGLVIE